MTGGVVVSVSVVRALAALCLGISVFWANSDAQAQGHVGSGQPQSSQVMQDYTTQSIGAVLQRAGLRWTSEMLEGNTPVVIADTFGVRIYFFPGSCASMLLRGCSDVYMISVITAPAVDKDKLIKFNDEGSFTYVAADSEGYTVNRYDFEQTGESAVNFLAAITLFRRDVLFFLDEFGFSSNTISELKRQQTDLMLNLRPENVPGAMPDLAPSDQSTLKQNDLDHLLDLVWDKEKLLKEAE